MTLRSLRRSRSGLSALAATALALSAISLVSAPEADAATTKIRIVQHNVEKRPGPVTKAMEKAVAINAQAITLQEVCASDVHLIREFAQARGETWTVNAQQSRTDGCAAGDDVMTVAVRTAGGATASQPALSPDEAENDQGVRYHQRQQELVCLTWGQGPVKTVCSVHIALGKAFVAGTNELARPVQIKQVKDHAYDFTEKGHAVIIGGDFNAVPKDTVMNRMYAKGLDSSGNEPNGRFFEATQLTKPQSAERRGAITATTGDGGTRKIDYVFFSKNTTPWTQDGASIDTFTTGSDHKMVTAAATIES